MARRPAPPPSSPDSPDDIELQFYEALRQADIDKLMSLWADEDEIACVHPGGPRVLGPQAVRASFESVFAHGAVDVQPEAVRRLVTHACAVHHLVERVQGLTREGPQTAYVIATNVYVRTPLGWRMLVHHASPGTDESGAELGDNGALLH